MMRRHLQGRRRGFSLIELLIAATLSTVFAVLIGQTVLSTTRASLLTTARSVAQAKARAGLNDLERALVGARPLGECRSPQRGLPINQCLVSGETGFALVSASADALTFYAYTTTSSDSVILSAPDKVVVEVDANMVLTVKRYKAASSATYTNPSWPSGAAPYRTLALGTVADRNVFSYIAGDGTDFGATTLTAPQLGQVAMIGVRASVTYSNASATGTFSLIDTVALSGATIRSGR